MPIDADGVGLGRRADGTLGPTRAPGPGSGSGLRIVADRRGIVLESTLPQPVHVNGRPVRARALLRPGDRIVCGASDLVLRTVAVPLPPNPGEPSTGPGYPVAPRAWVRCLVGRHAGQTRGLDSGAALPWSGQDAAVVHLALEGSQLVARAHRPGFLSVDGHAVATARLAGGEQVVVGAEHYLIEVPGLDPPHDQVPAVEGHGDAEPAGPAEMPVIEGRSGGFSPWWLLAAAIAIAAALALLFGRV
jgi:hypothetical protein